MFSMLAMAASIWALLAFVMLLEEVACTTMGSVVVAAVAAAGAGAAAEGAGAGAGTPVGDHRLRTGSVHMARGLHRQLMTSTSRSRTSSAVQAGTSLVYFALCTAAHMA